MSRGNKIIVVILSILFLTGIGFLLFNFFGRNIIPFNKPTAIINSNKIELIIAKSQKEKEVGLSSYKNLPNNQGMIFSFGRPDYYSFWMKSMKFSIDIIYLNNKKVVTIFENVKAPLNNQVSLQIYKPSAPADTVLEINAGLSKKYNLKIGDKITYENFGG